MGKEPGAPGLGSVGCQPGLPPPGTETQAGPASHPGWVAASQLPVPQHSPADLSPAPPFSSRGPRKEGRGGLIQGCLLVCHQRREKTCRSSETEWLTWGVWVGVVSGSHQPPPQTHPTAAGRGVQQDTIPPPQAVPPSRGRVSPGCPRLRPRVPAYLGGPREGERDVGGQAWWGRRDAAPGHLGLSLRPPGRAGLRSTGLARFGSPRGHSDRQG